MIDQATERSAYRLGYCHARAAFNGHRWRFRDLTTQYLRGFVAAFARGWAAGVVAQLAGIDLSDGAE